MSREQLEQIVIDAYGIGGAAKEYFDFFLNPDTEKLLEKMENDIVKELRRVKWGYCRARVSLIKKAVDKVISFNTDVVTAIKAYGIALLDMGFADKFAELLPSHDNLVVRLTGQLISYGNRHNAADLAIRQVNDIINDDRLGLRYRRLVSDALDNC